MTAINQDFSTFQGDTSEPVFTILDGSGAPIDLFGSQQIEWNARESLSTAVALRKLFTLSQIVFVNTGVDGKIRILITPADTAALTGQYIHEVIVTDSGGNVSTVATGVLTVGRAPEATFSGDPQFSNVDAVRFLTQDIDTENPLLSDQGIAFVLASYPNVYLAAAQCCRVIAARFAQKVNKRVGDLSINFSDKAKNYLMLAEELELQGSLSGLVPYAGGISRSDKMQVRDNTDRVRPPFSLKQFDNPSGPNNTSEFDPNPIGPLP